MLDVFNAVNPSMRAADFRPVQVLLVDRGKFRGACRPVVGVDLVHFDADRKVHCVEADTVIPLQSDFKTTDSRSHGSLG